MALRPSEPLFPSDPTDPTSCETCRSGFQPTEPPYEDAVAGEY